MEGEAVWSECSDPNTGYPYYWNTKTNEVVWEKPIGFRRPEPQPRPPVKNEVSPSMAPAARSPNRQSITSWPISQPPPSSSNSSSTSSIKAAAVARSKKAAASASKRRQDAPVTLPVFYGPSLPEPKPEEIAMQKIKKFEEDFARRVMAEVSRENPPDWRNTMPRALHTKPFKWNQQQPLLPIWKELVAKDGVVAAAEAPSEPEKPKAVATNPLALVAGYASDSDDQSDEEEEEKPPSPPPPASDTASKAGIKRKMHIEVKSSQSKLAKTTPLKPVASVFQEDDEQDGDGNEDRLAASSKDSSARASSDRKDKRDRHGKKIYDSATGSAYKKSIDAIAETLCDKLEALKVGQIKVSALKILAVKVETLFEAWQCGALSAGYMQKTLNELSRQMAEIESDDLVPPGWKATWDRSNRHYVYENLITGEHQLEKPDDDDDDDDEEEDKDLANGDSPSPASKDEPNNDRKSSAEPDLESERNETVPPLPPLPPPPPPVSQPPPPPPPSESTATKVESSDTVESAQAGSGGGVVDMELSEEDEDASPTKGIEHDHLSSALDSFYASLGADSGAATPSDTPPLSSSPAPTTSAAGIPVGIVEPPSEDSRGSNSPGLAEDDRERKKKKTKISSALSMKKKGVENLVAKWQNIQDQRK